MTPLSRFIQISPSDGSTPRVRILSAGEMLAEYDAAERVRLGRGLAIPRDGAIHLDLQAFHARMTDPARAVVVSLDTARALRATPHTRTREGA